MSTRIAAFIRQNVIGLIAIFIALGGTAYANNEWTGANIVDNSLTSADYKNYIRTRTAAFSVWKPMDRSAVGVNVQLPPVPEVVVAYSTGLPSR